MKILALEVTNFKAFDNASFTFGDKVDVRGDNYQGKTSLPEAIMFGLYGTTLTGSPRTEDLVKQGTKKAEVTVTFEDAGVTNTVVRTRAAKTEVYLNGDKSTQTEVDKLLPDLDRFLTVFSPGYFTSLPDKDGRNLLMRLIKAPSQDEVLKQMTDKQRELLNNERLLDPEEAAKDLRSDIKELDNQYSRTEGRIQQLRVTIQRELPSPVEFDESELAALQQQLTNATSQVTSQADELKRQSQELRVRYERLKGQLKAAVVIPYHEGQPCPVCARSFDADSLAHALSHHSSEDAKVEAFNAQVMKEIENVLAQGKTIKAQLAELPEPTDTSDVQRRLVELQAKRAEASAHNAYVERVHKEVESEKTMLADLEKQLDEIENERFVASEKVKVLNAYRAKYAEIQINQLKQHLNRVDIQLFDIAKSTGEIKAVFNILYDGKEFKVLSTSERIRANLELANMLNKVMGTDIPVYIDNCESITHFDAPSVTQLFTATVVKGAPLTVSSDTESESVEKGRVAS